MKKLIILDRDGVINHDSDAYIKSPQEWHPIPGSLEAIALLNQKGYRVCIATNQSGIARRLYDEQMLTQIHQKMHALLQRVKGCIDEVFYCPHSDEAHCACRKPKPGLLYQIAEHYQVTLNEVPFLGDSWRDIEAAIAAGAQPHLVLTGNGKQTLHQYADKLLQVPRHADLLAFAHVCKD